MNNCMINGKVNIKEFKDGGGDLLAQWISSMTGGNYVQKPKAQGSLTDKDTTFNLNINTELKYVEFVVTTGAVTGIAKIYYE